MLYRTAAILCLVTCVQSSLAATVHVPGDYATIQAAIDAARPGDTLQVAAGRYRERLQLRPGITLRSAGDDERGARGLKRAEVTVIDGGGANDERPGVAMAEGSTLDGFTVTQVGLYVDSVWQQHFDSHGEELADHDGSMENQSRPPAISIKAIHCTVINNIVHHNGDVGLAVSGSREFLGIPLILKNECHRNMGSGIIATELAAPIIRENICHENAGAGIACIQSSPIVIDNRCFGNIRAGLGCSDEATPVLRGNDCYQNRRAGIGCDGANPLIIGNICRENELSGIGIRGAANATIVSNKCLENKLVAIGVIDGSKATILENELVRTGGVPPIITVSSDSTASIQGNKIEGGGVAAILLQGHATVRNNIFVGQGDRQGKAVWVREGATAAIADNSFDGYRRAVDSTKATVSVTGNSVRGFQDPAILVRDAPKPAHVFGNTAITNDEKATVVEIQGPAGVVGDNVTKKEASGAISEPKFRATSGRLDTRIQFFSEAEHMVFDIQSPSGIDRATIAREAAEWPQRILLRLHVRGLESLKVHGLESIVEWSIPSSGESAPSISLWSGKVTTAIDKDSPLYGPVRIVGRKKTIPLQDGYFDVLLPSKLLDGNPPELRLDWIDFYRK